MKRSLFLPRWVLSSALFFALLPLACGSDGGGGDATNAGGTAGSGGRTGAAGSFGAGSGGTGFAGSGIAGAGGGAGTSGADSAGTAGTGVGGAGLAGAGFGGAGVAGTSGGGASSGGSTFGGAGAAGAGNPTAGAGGSAGQGGGAGIGGMAAFNPCPAVGAPCIIMPLGDSITDGVGSSGGGYRVELFHNAVQAHQSITFVGNATDPNGPAMVDGKTFPRNHEGHPGYTIDNSSTTSGISPLVDASIGANHPNIILLMIGTNDVNRNIDPTNAPTRLGALLDRIFSDAPSSLVVVAKITPWQDDGTNASAVQPYNNAVATVVQTRAASGKHVALVDMFTPFTANTDYKTALMSDYLHPNDAGYVIMGNVWYAAIKSYLPAAP